MSDAGRKLSELRICDLKDELEKRKLDVVGAKATLVERLEKALKEEGLDPEIYVFPKRAQQVKTDTNNSQNVKETDAKVKDSPELKNNQNKCNVNETKGNTSKSDADKQLETEHDEEIDQVGTVDDECLEMEEQNNEDSVKGTENGLGENNVELLNNQDPDESINLTIGEDEQEFLHEEERDEKESTAELNENQKDKAAAATDVKADKAANPVKDDKRNGKEEIKKKDEKSSNEKMEDSNEQKSTLKNTQKDDKEKSSNSTNNAAAGSATKSETGSKTVTPTRNLWVSGLSALTRASDLKTIFSKYGKVIGAKVVTNTRTPGTRCYGYVTMSSSMDASRCIEHLHRTELHGRIISVERTKNEIGGPSANAKENMKHSYIHHSHSNGRHDSKRKDDNKSISSKDGYKSTEDNRRKSVSSRKDDAKGGNERKDDERERKDKDGSKARSEASSTRRVRDHDHDRERIQRQRERERERIRQREILSYQKIRQERERQRQREREREQREEERRRREIRERQRLEEQRLAEERKKLALERERLEREKAELLRLERERQKLEREKIELERLELKRQQMKIMQARDEPIKRGTKRGSNDRYTDVSDRKRPSGSDSRFEAPPPPRFDTSLVSQRSYDKKRDDYGSSSSKRGIDDYSSTKRLDYSKRDDYSSASKRSGIDEYSTVPAKRPTDDYPKRSNDYLASKRGLDDYSSSTKRDTSRDEYKREVEIRHIPASGSSAGGSFHSTRDVGSTSMHKGGNSRYVDSDRSSGGSYRRGGMDDIRNSSNTKRYDSSGSYGGNTSSNNGGVWASTSSHMSSGNVGAPQLKSYVSNGLSSNMHGSANWQKSSGVDEGGWRPLTSNQDRYDRTYNERSSGYPSGSGIYTNNSRPNQERYGGAVSSRY